MIKSYFGLPWQCGHEKYSKPKGHPLSMLIDFHSARVVVCEISLIEWLSLPQDSNNVNSSSGDCGNEGTNGCWGASAGDNWAKVVEECKNETSSAREKDRTDCFFIVWVLLKDGLDDIGKECKW